MHRQAPGPPPPDPGARSADTSVLLGSRALLAVVARSLGGALEEVTLPQFRLLVVLSTHGVMRSGDLAEAGGVHPSTLSRTADRLVRGGWVERVTNPDNRREILLTLTAAGVDLVLDVTRRRSREISTIMGRMSIEERQGVSRAFDAFSRAAGESATSDLLMLGLGESDLTPPA
ncbi:MAG: MarR family transcriptional regulator [Lapillicoccus sp.]